MGQIRVAEALDTSEATVSKWKSQGDLARFARMLAFLELQIVPVAAVHVDPAWLDAVLRLSHDGVGAARDRLKVKS